MSSIVLARLPVWFKAELERKENGIIDSPLISEVFRTLSYPSNGSLS